MKSDGQKMRMNVKKLALIAILTSVALIIFIIEAQIPLPIPIPSVKLGLANAVTLFALFLSRNDKDDVKKADTDFINVTLTNVDAFAILVSRIILGAVFTGRFLAFAYSITGGVLGFIAQVLMKRFVSRKQIWVCGAIGAVFHNIGQIFAAVVITGTPAIIVYLPALIIAGIVTGVITGLIAQMTIERISL